MPRYVMRRAFPERERVPVSDDGAAPCKAVIEQNAEEGVTRLHSYVSEGDRSAFCVCDAPTREAIRRAAARNELPVGQITRVRVHDSYCDDHARA